MKYQSTNYSYHEISEAGVAALKLSIVTIRCSFMWVELLPGFTRPKEFWKILCNLNTRQFEMCFSSVGPASNTDHFFLLCQMRPNLMALAARSVAVFLEGLDF